MNYNEYTSATLNNETTEKIKIRRRVFTGNEPHDISLADASRLTKRFRDSVAEDAIKGGFFGRLAFEKILVQDGCVGIRCYFAAFDDGSPTIVMTGVTREGNDIWDGVVNEDILPCPPYCGATNSLNSDVAEDALTFERTGTMFTGNENHLVTIAEASRYTRNFRSTKDETAVKGGYIGRNAFEKILAQAGCVGIRMYFALNEDGTPTLVTVGVKSNGNDIFDGVINEDILPCPPYCGAKNPLNQ